jgi:hypothetical protein
MRPTSPHPLGGQAYKPSLCDGLYACLCLAVTQERGPQLYKLTNNSGIEIRQGTYESLTSILDRAMKIGARLFVRFENRWVEIVW